MINKKNFWTSPLCVPAFLAVAFLFGSVDNVWAQTLGDFFENACNNTRPFGALFSWIAYSTGAFCAVQGIHHLMMHTESRQNHPLRGGLGYLGGSAALLSMPSVAKTLISTLVPSGGGGTNCVGGGSGGGGTGLDGMLSGFVTNIKEPLIDLVSVIAIACGVWMLIRGTMKATKYGVDPKSNSMHHISANLVFGAILMTIGSSLNVVLGSIFGSGTGITNITAGDVLKWGFVSAVGGGSTQFANAIAAALVFFQLIGVIAFVRGWLIMKKVVEGGGNVTMSQGITHIVGGAIAINIYPFLVAMDHTFGTNML